MKHKLIQIFSFILLLLVVSTNVYANSIEKNKAETTSSKITTTPETQTTPSLKINEVRKEFPPITASSMAGEQINWQVISGGGTLGTAPNISVSGTIGQTSVVMGVTTDFQVNAGFWQNFINESEGCCIGFRGNVDNSPDDMIDIQDLVTLIAYMFSGGATPECMDEVNVDGSASMVIDIQDLVSLIAYMFSDGANPAPCP